MEINFASKLTRFPALYEGFDDVPGLGLAVHLHSWRFPDPEEGEARFRVEIREGSSQPEGLLTGVGFVLATSSRVVSWNGNAPLAQAILDGLFSHQEIHQFFSKAAQEALKLAEPPEEEVPMRIPLSVLKKRKIY